MSFINTKRAVVAGALTLGTIAGVSAAAIAGPAQESPQQPAANAVRAASAPVPNAPEVRITSADYPLEYRLTRVGGDGFGSNLDPNSTREVQAEGYSTVTFFVRGTPVIGYAPLSDGKTLACQAAGTVEAPEVACSFE